MKMLILPCSMAYSIGPWTAYNQPWNRGTLIENVDFQQKSVINPVGFPNNQLLRWLWPATSPPVNGLVWGFNSICFGNYYDTAPQIPIKSQLTRDITTLIMTIDWQTAWGSPAWGSPDNYTVIVDMFLTYAPSDFSSPPFAAEIDLMLHVPAASQEFLNTLTTLGTFTISGINWTCKRDPYGAQGQVFYVYPTNLVDVTQITLDLKAVFSALSSYPTWPCAYFNGTGLIVEQFKSWGEVRINGLSAVYS